MDDDKLTERKMRNKNITLVDTLYQIFSRRPYLFLFLTVSSTTLLLAIWLPNIAHITDVILSGRLTFGQKFSYLGSTLGGYRTNFTSSSRLITTLVAILFGVNSSILAYYFRTRATLERTAGTSLAGILSGLVGVGCASCGSVVLSSIFGVAATTSFIGILPLRGMEIGLLSIGLLSLSIYLTTRRIQNPISCKIDFKHAQTANPN